MFWGCDYTRRRSQCRQPLRQKYRNISSDKYIWITSQRGKLEERFNRCSLLSNYGRSISGGEPEDKISREYIMLLCCTPNPYRYLENFHYLDLDRPVKVSEMSKCYVFESQY